ncbi:hypothetical protein PM082_018027 [Marasmius tenuissimus]|nr:hypothetical protein PM082_018027 [Marasmius tenuissimus]
MKDEQTDEYRRHSNPLSLRETKIHFQNVMPAAMTKPIPFVRDPTSPYDDLSLITKGPSNGSDFPYPKIRFSDTSQHTASSPDCSTVLTTTKKKTEAQITSTHPQILGSRRNLNLPRRKSLLSPARI